MAKQNFEIIDGVYVGPDVWEGELDLREYKDTLISLGSLEKVTGHLDINDCANLTTLGLLNEVGEGLDLGGCTSLVSLGVLKKVKGWLFLFGCTSLTSLESLITVGDFLCLDSCTSLTSLGSLTEVKEGDMFLKGCASLTSLGSLTKARTLDFGGYEKTFQEVQEKILYYASLPAHEALNALFNQEVQSVPLYKNILLKSLQGG